jgi:5-formyltetrahydrofolate cyclo-ligase
MVVPPTALNQLRRKLREKRQDIANNRKPVALQSSAALNNIVIRASCVGLYLPVGGEPDPFPLLGGYTGMTCLPYLSSKSATMIFRYWAVSDPLMTSVWNGQQPSVAASVVEPDVILVPLLGFDAAFNRIGQGGGHYDRYLAAHPSACRIGVAWEAQRVDRIDAQPWDVPLDAIVTEADFYTKDLNRCQSH